jgi:predicted PurR-regulated permease PerM
MTKRILIIAIGVMSTLLALATLWQFRTVVIYVLIALLIASAFRRAPGNSTLRPRLVRIQLVITYVGSIGLLSLLVLLAGRFLINDFQQLVESITEQSTWLLPAWLEGSSVERAISERLPTPNQLLATFTTQRDLVLSTLVGFTQGIGDVLSGLLVALFLSVYWSLNQNHFERLWLSLLPAEIRKQARHISRAIEYELGAYTRSEVIQSALAVILLAPGYLLLGSPYPALLAVTGGLARLVPVIGSTLALVLPFLLGSLTSTPLGIASVVYTALVLLALQIWVEPRLFKPRQDNPVLTFMILLAMADVFGLLGIVAAPPLSIICQSLWRLLVSERSTDTGSQVIDLRGRYSRLQTTIDEMAGVTPPLVLSSMERLNELIEKAEPILDIKQQEEPANILRSS